MYINKIGYNLKNWYTPNKTEKKPAKPITNPTFEARVDKGMIRFYEFNSKRMPTTMKTYLDSLQDKFSLTPIQAQRNAYIKLQEAKSVDDVQKLFPEEELFIYLEKAKNTSATNGLLGIYREFKDLYESVLKSGEDLTIYILKKIFLETKMLEEINKDLDNDLHEDIKSEFKRRYPNSDYIHSSTLKSLGIYNPDTAYLNSLKFTRDGYSDEFGAKISEAQLKYWNSLSEEEKFTILSKRCEGRDNWWNALSYNEKLEYAAGIESEDELYKNYKKFVNSEKRRIRKETQEGTIDEKDKIEAPKHTRIKVGDSKIQDRDIFVLWMKKNLEKFYAKLSEADKDSVHLKRVHRLSVRWQEMTPEEKTELINKMRAGREPGRFIMIDAWNHSRVLIRELSDFLKSKQIMKPVDVLYASEEFSSFQSQIMTEFWATHRDLAEEFGNNIHRAYLRVEESLRKGQFQDLKQEILRDRAYRMKLIERERLEETRKIQESTQVSNAYKNEFINTYKTQRNSMGILPKTYIEDVTKAMLEMYPREIIREYTEALKTGKTISQSAYEEMSKCAETPEFKRSQRAMEMALAEEFASKWSDLSVYKSDLSILITMLAERVAQDKAGKTPIKQKIDLKQINRLYDECRQDMSKSDLEMIVSSYFKPKENMSEAEKQIAFDELRAYVSSFGRSIIPLFKWDSDIGKLEYKAALNDRFMSLMPNGLKEKFKPKFEKSEAILQELQIHDVIAGFVKKYEYLPIDVLNAYVSELETMFYKLDENFYIDGKVIGKFDVFKGLSEKNNKMTTIFKLPKDDFKYENSLKLLAMEQVLADELYDILKEEKVYSFDFEELCFVCDSILHNNIGRIKAFLQLEDENLVPSRNLKIFSFKKRYNDYMKELLDAQKELPEGEKLSGEDILYILNPAENMPIRDNYIIERLGKYGFKANV